MPILEAMPISGTSTIITVDTGDLNVIAANANWMATESQRVLRGRLTRSVNKLRADLEEAAPEGQPARDWQGNIVERNPDPVKLKQSFRVVRTDPDGRAVITLAPRKFSWTNYGARPPTFGTGYIFPRKKKALSWFGLAHPVWYVAHHPGTRATHWADAVVEKYNYGGVFIQHSAVAVAAEHADWWVETFANLNARRKDSVVRRLFTDVMASVQENSEYGV